jgi:hypothetical protein
MIEILFACIMLISVVVIFFITAHMIWIESTSYTRSTVANEIELRWCYTIIRWCFLLGFLSLIVILIL